MPTRCHTRPHQATAKLSLTLPYHYYASPSHADAKLDPTLPSPCSTLPHFANASLCHAMPMPDATEVCNADTSPRQSARHFAVAVQSRCVSTRRLALAEHRSSVPTRHRTRLCPSSAELNSATALPYPTVQSHHPTVRDHASHRHRSTLTHATIPRRYFNQRHLADAMHVPTRPCLHFAMLHHAVAGRVLVRAVSPSRNKRNRNRLTAIGASPDVARNPTSRGVGVRKSCSPRLPTGIRSMSQRVVAQR